MPNDDRPEWIGESERMAGWRGFDLWTNGERWAVHPTDLGGPTYTVRGETGGEISAEDAVRRLCEVADDEPQIVVSPHGVFIRGVTLGAYKPFDLFRALSRPRYSEGEPPCDGLYELPGRTLVRLFRHESGAWWMATTVHPDGCPALPQKSPLPIKSRRCPQKRWLT